MYSKTQNSDEDLFEKVYQSCPRKGELEFGAPSSCLNIGVQVFNEVGRFVRRLLSFAVKGGFNHVNCELSYDPHSSYFMFHSYDGIYMSTSVLTTEERRRRKGRFAVSHRFFELADVNV